MFDALTTSRSYRQPLSPAEGLRVLREEAGLGFWDAKIVELFARLWIAGVLRPESPSPVLDVRNRPEADRNAWPHPCPVVRGVTALGAPGAHTTSP